MRKIKILIIVFFSFHTLIEAQNLKKCNATKLMNYEMENSPEYKNARQENIIINREFINTQKEQPTISIPIVVHIIYKSNHPNIGYGTNIPIEQVEDAIRILNEDYSKTNPEFPNPLAVGGRNTFLNQSANANIEFCLANTDPNGNATTGIIRTLATNSNGTFDADDNTDANAMKLTSLGGNDGWTPSKYLNIWICDLVNSQGGGTTLGYAYLPGLPSWNAWKDGLVVDYRYFGTTGMAAPSSDGRTPTHEIGHYLGLNHTFAEDGWNSPCVDSQGNLQCCDNDDSNVFDTPATDGIYWGFVNSTSNRNTCNDLQYGFSSDLLDMDENYMSYAANTWMFTQDQVDEMQATLYGYRNTLRNSIANGTTVNCSGTVNINNITNKNLVIYPNPAKTTFTIKTADSEKIQSIYVRNILGYIVYEKSNSFSNSVSISNLTNGIYFIHIKTPKQTYMNKVIVH